MVQKLFLMLSLVGCLWAEDASIAKLFENAQVKGTIIIESLDGKERYVYNDARARTPVLPASTFKIPNTLIALQEGVVSADSIIVWDGVQRNRVEWNHDQNLSSAFKSSCVWCYQRFARAIGLEKYTEYLHQLHYGNAEGGTDVERFWLDGALRISAYEQITFLKKLYKNELPFEQEHLDLLKSIMIDEQGNGYVLRAKTGWAVPKNEAEYGWYVGYVENTKGVYFFATNLLSPTLCKALTLEILKAKGFLE